MKSVNKMSIKFNSSESEYPLKFYDIGLKWVQHKVYRPHGFRYYHWLQTDKGTGFIKIGQKVIKLSPHQGFLMRPYTPYSCYPDTDQIWITSFLTFEGTMIDSMASFLDLNEFQIYQDLDKNLENFIENNYKSFTTYDYLSSLEQSTLICTFLMYLKRNAYINELDFSQSKIVNKIIEYIRLHYQEKISNEMLASLSGYSIPHTVRLFKAEVEVTPMEYLTRFRLRMAKTLVDFKPEISIDEIASLVGYSNISYFIQQYKKMFQTTPGQERHHVL